MAMNSPQILSIHIAAAKGSPMVARSIARAIAGKGLEGDRYADAIGTWSDYPKDHELTLIEIETLEALNADGICLEPGAIRRNLVTRGIRLNDLVGKTFYIGAVQCRGTRLAEPCSYLERLLGVSNLVKGLAGRGGLRAVITFSGSISVGDAIHE